MQIETKELEDALAEFETKRVRYVRTPEGEERYGKPIGSPIVAKLVVGLGVIAAAAGIAAAPFVLGGSGGSTSGAVPSASRTIPGLDTLPKRPAPTTVQGFRDMWDTQISSKHWGGADVSLSVPMKDGRSVWLYGDTVSNMWGMQHSTAIVQDGGNVRVANEGMQILPNGRNTADGRKVIYWIEGAKEVAPNTLEVTAQETSIGTESVWDFKRNKKESRVATVKVDEAGDMEFVGWKGWTKDPKIDNTLYPIPGKGMGYFAYSKQSHPQFKLASGNTLHTYARNRDNLKPGEQLPYEDYKPVFVDGPALEAGSFKGYLDAANTMLEVKARFVRTPEGADWFDQPIGSVIVGKNKKRLKFVGLLESEYDGWEKVATPKGQFYVGKEDDGIWFVTDLDDNEISRHKTQDAALQWLDDDAAKSQPQASKPNSRAAKLGLSERDYAAAYQRGWRHSNTAASPTLDRNPHRGGEPLYTAWEDGYMDHATDRPKDPTGSRYMEDAATTKPVGTGKFTPKPGAFNDPRVEELQELSKLPKSMVNNQVRRRMEELSEQIKKDMGAPSATQAPSTPKTAVTTGGGLSVGGRARTEWGDGTVSHMSGRAVVMKLDNGETINIVTGTPGHRRLLDMNKATTKEIDWSKPGIDIVSDLKDTPVEEILDAVAKSGNHPKSKFALRVVLNKGEGERLTARQLADAWTVDSFSDHWTTSLLDRTVSYLESLQLDSHSEDARTLIAMRNRAAHLHNRDAAGLTGKPARQIKSLVEFIADEMEVKVIRYVRTPAGARRFKQPIGSVIVAKGRGDTVGRVFKNLKVLPEHGDDWNKFEGSDGNIYHSVQVGENGKPDFKWYATDEKDNVLMEDDTAESLLEQLDTFIAANKGKTVVSSKRRTMNTNDGGAVSVSKSPNTPQRASTTPKAKKPPTKRAAAAKPSTRPTATKKPTVRKPAAAKPAAKPAAPSGPKKTHTADGYPLFHQGDETNPDKITLPKNLSKSKTARLGSLTKVETDAPGWEKFEDGPLTRYIGKSEDGRWELRDEEDNIYAVAETGTKASAIKLLKMAHLSYDSKEHPVRHQPYRVNSGKYAIRSSEKNRSTIAANKLRHVESEADLAKFIATHGAVMDNGSIPRTHANILISDDPGNPNVSTMGMFMQRGGAKDADWQYRYRKTFRSGNDAKKWERITRFDKDVHKVDEQITKTDLSTDDDMMVVALMRKYGARVGSDKRTKNDDEPRGMTELTLKDVQIDGNTVKIGYPGKKYNAATGAGWQSYEIDDPNLVAAFKKRIKGLKDENDLFFPNATASSTIKFARDATGVAYTNHDYRRLFATQQAFAMMKTTRPQPKTPDEVAAAIKDIGAKVDVMLNDKNQALASYINPAVFDKWNKIK